MRPTATKQSALRTPLNHVLATEANVRVVRTLSLADVPLSRGELARETALHVRGIPAVLENLENLGVVESIGRGHSRPVRLRQAHPLWAHIRALFHEEAKRAENVLQNILAAVRALEPRPDAAWIEGSVATGTDAPLDPIIVGVLGAPKPTDHWEAVFRDRIRTTQTGQDVAVELRIRWRADIETADSTELELLRSVRPLLGPPPLDLLGLSGDDDSYKARGRGASHAVRDSDALAHARRVANELRSRPDLVDEALRYIDRRIPSASESERLTLGEWQDILSTHSLGRLRTFLVSDSQRAKRLRQSMPFVTPRSAADRKRVRRRASKPARS